MRIDRLLCEMNVGSRSQIKEMIKKGQVCVDGFIVKKPEMQVDEKRVKIGLKGKEYSYRPYVYYVMNKPAGIITATTDEKDKTVMDLFKEQMLLLKQGDLTGIPIKDIFPVGRLDKDTTGLLLLTNDGEMAHNLLAPGKHVPKEYLVRTDLPITNEMVSQLEAGMEIGHGEKTLPAKVECSGEKECHLTIREGKYHQVKRMFCTLGTHVVYLKRLSMGSLSLDEELEEGQVRELTQKEVSGLCSKI